VYLALSGDRLVLEPANISLVCNQQCEIVDACYDGVVSSHINVLTKETRLNDIIYKVWRYIAGEVT